MIFFVCSNQYPAIPFNTAPLFGIGVFIFLLNAEILSVTTIKRVLSSTRRLSRTFPRCRNVSLALLVSSLVMQFIVLDSKT